MSYAATTACPTGTASSQSPTGTGYAENTATNVQTPGAGGGSPDNSLSALNALTGGTFAAGGCLATDISFNNFRVVASGNGGSTVAGVVSNDGLAGAALATDGSDMYANFSSGGKAASVEFASVRGDGSGAEGTANDGLNNFYDSNGSSASTYHMLFTADAGSNTIMSSALSMRFFTFTGGGNSAVVRMCGNYTTTTVQTAAFTNCGAIGGTFTSYTVSLNSLQNDALIPLISSGVGFNRVYVDLFITLDGSNTNPPNRTYSSFYGAQLSFYETPEPSTFAFMGAGLVGLMALARRRRTA